MYYNSLEKLKSPDYSYNLSYFWGKAMGKPHLIYLTTVIKLALDFKGIIRSGSCWGALIPKKIKCVTL